MKNSKTININELEGFEIVPNLTLSGTSDEIKKVDKRVDVLDELFAQYLKTQNQLSDYVAKSQDYVNKYVREQLHNQEVFQIFVEREIFINNLNADMVRAEVIAIAEIPWWKRNKKNIERAKEEIKGYFEGKRDAGMRAFDERLLKAGEKIKDDCNRVQK